MFCADPVKALAEMRRVLKPEDDSRSRSGTSLAEVSVFHDDFRCRFGRF